MHTKGQSELHDCDTLLLQEKLDSCCFLHCYSHIKYCGVLLEKSWDSYFVRNHANTGVFAIYLNLVWCFKKTRVIYKIIGDSDFYRKGEGCSIL